MAMNFGSMNTGDAVAEMRRMGMSEADAVRKSLRDSKPPVDDARCPTCGASVSKIQAATEEPGPDDEVSGNAPEITDQE